jgi:hypothetical protein
MSERKQNIFGLEKVASHPDFGLGQGKLLKGIVSHLTSGWLRLDLWSKGL